MISARPGARNQRWKPLDQRARAAVVLMLATSLMAASCSGARGDVAAQIQREYAELARFYRSKGLKLLVTFDATDGLRRDKDSRELREASRSIAEPAIQQLYRDYVKAWVQMIRPDYIGLGAETNLIRLTAPRAIYEGLKVVPQRHRRRRARDHA